MRPEQAKVRGNSLQKAPALLRGGWLPSAGGLSSRLAYARAKAAGADLTSLLDRAGLSRERIEDARSTIKVRDQIRFLSLAAAAVDDDLLGFHLAQSSDLREIG